MMKQSFLEREALKFATAAHGEQKRKYTGDPYIVHPMSVAEMVRSVDHSPEMIAAALLHDTVEDTEVTLAQIKEQFGAKVATLVAWLTDVSTPYHGNRTIRKTLDAQHTAMAPPEAKTIKLADMIDNASSIEAGDPGFWVLYHKEMSSLMDSLKDGDPELWKRAADLILNRAEPWR